MKKLFLPFVLFFLSSIIPFKASATHYMGGEITWECLSTGHYRFVLKAYRECYTSFGAAAQYANTQTLMSNSPSGNIMLSLLPGYPKDLSPECNPNPAFAHISCPNMPNANANMGAVQEYIFTSDSVYPNGVILQGTPPASGWIFHWGSCCRNPSTNIANSNSKSWRLRAIMYPYNGKNAFPCYDNSPVFAESPRTVVQTGSPFSFNNLAFDKELDSLSYEWGQPLLQSGNPIQSYAAGYSYNNPLPDTSVNPNNVPAVMDPVTGMVSLTSFTSGAFVTSVKVTSYRNGVKISEIWRDIQVVLTVGGTNSPPAFTKPFNNGTSWDTTVYAGDTINFALMANDFQFLPNGSSQNVKFEYFGQEFGQYISMGSTGKLVDTVGCLRPPCATLNPAPGSNAPVSGLHGIQTSFRWVTTCGHIDPVDSLGTSSYTYRFLVKASDDFCPVPGITNKIITITVKDKPPLPAPTADSIYFDYNNMDVALSWNAVSDPHNIFDAYYIYYSPTLNGNYTLIDSVTNINTTSYSYHTGAVNEAYFKVKTKYSTICNSGISAPLQFQLNVTGIKTSIKTDGFYLYQNKPNPASSKTTIEFITDKPSTAGFTLTSIQGKIIEQRTIKASSGVNKIVVDLSSIPAGVYNYFVEIDGIRKSGKMIVMKNISE